MWKKRLASFTYAFTGIWTLVRTQPNARIHALATLIVTLAGLFFGLGRTEWLFLLWAMALVWATEAINTALEFLTDLVSPGYHELAGKAKDVAAAAVLICAFFAAITGIVIFLPHVKALFF